MSDVLVRREGDICIITLNRPERMNALSDAMIDGIAAALDEAEAMQARAIVLTGAGRGFCSGADLKAHGAATTRPDMSARLRRIIHPTILRMTRLPIPIVTALNGAAVGAGASYALAADFVVASRSAFLLFAFVNVGLVPDGGASWLLTHLVGRQRATEMMMLGERLPAEKAAEWGMVYKLVDDDRLIEEAMALARRLAKAPPASIRLMKRNLAIALEGSLEETLAAECVAQREAGYTEDFGEGLRAFAEKRPPVFTGR